MSLGIPQRKSSRRGSKKIQREDTEIKFSYMVDQINGPFHTIQSAIDEAPPMTTIKVNFGLYKENLVITKPGLKIESRDINNDVYIMGHRGPAVYINLNPGENAQIQNINFVHKGGASRNLDFQNTFDNSMSDLGATPDGSHQFIETMKQDGIDETEVEYRDVDQ